jgi:hypothetical protein
MVLLYLRWAELLFELVLLGVEALYERDERIFSKWPISDVFLVPWLAQFDWILDKTLEISKLKINTDRISVNNIEGTVKWLNQPHRIYDSLNGIEKAEQIIQEASRQWMTEYYRCLNAAIEKSKLEAIHEEESNDSLRIFCKIT